jgi:hypothetical protein
MPSVATIESVLRLSAPVQLRVSAPVQFRLGPASQRAECREVSVPDWLPRAQSGAEQRMSVPDWLVDWLPPSAEWSRECLSPFSPPPNRPPREVSVPDWLVDWLPPSAEWSRAENVCAGLAGRLAAAERRVEQSRVDWLSVPVQPFPNRPPRARECLSPISVLSRIGWSIGCRRPQSGECLSPFSPRSALPESASSRQRVSVPDQRPFPDWLVDWLPPSAEWREQRVSVPVQPSPESASSGSVCAGLAGRLAATERRVEQRVSVPVRPPPFDLQGKTTRSASSPQSASGSVCPRLAGRLVAAELRVKQRVSVPVQLVSAVPRDCLSSISFFNQFRPGGACQDPLRTIPDQSLQVG